MKTNYFVLLLCSMIMFITCSSSSKDDDKDDQGGKIHEDQFQKLPKTGELKVMSFNVRYGSAVETDPNNNWDFRKAACLEMINDQKPSVIGFQEAVYTTQWLYFKDNLAADYDGYGVGRDDGAEKGECMGILYRKADVEMLDHGTFWLSDTPDVVSKALSWGAGHYRTATWGIFRMMATGQKFCYINTHLDLVPAARAKSMELIQERFALYNPDGLPQFLSADFNTTSEDVIFDDLEKTMYNSRDYAPEGHTDFNGTYNKWGEKSMIIDDIFYTSSLSVIEYHTVTESYGSSAFVSDHYPIYAIFKF